MKTQRKKKAFTLTELLVVVIVIGVLSAVVLPKFSKVIETRKTTESEELMAAVRTEQEKRCALDKDYIADLSQLSDIIPSTNTKNFVYSTNEAGTGIEAQSKGKYGYTLKMPSYKDGRLCCENEEECLKLNKDYPLCSDLIARADYQSGAECAGDNRPTVVQCVGPSTQTCGCLGKGTQSRVCNTTTGQWGAWGACSAPLFCSCPEDGKPASTQTCNGCGTQTRTVACNTANGEWQPSAWGTCSKTVEECTETEDDCCADGLSSSEFTACILEQYGADSTEYICASGKNLGYIKEIGSMAGASACASKLVGFGSFLRAANNTCSSTDTYCQKLRSENISWISSGFKKYACTGEKPNIIPRDDVDDGDDNTEPGKFNCCRVELAPRQTFQYNDAFGQVTCLNAAGTEMAQCPAHVVPGVKMNGSHGGLNCTYQYSCPFSGYQTGSTAYKYSGFVQKLRCVNYGDVCTADEVVWL